MTAPAERGSELVERDLQIDDLADALIPFLRAGLAAALAPGDQHDRLLELLGGFLVGIRERHQAHMAFLAERTGTLADIARDAFLGRLAADRPEIVLELGELLEE